jgi:hypothetical protein
MNKILCWTFGAMQSKMQSCSVYGPVCTVMWQGSAGDRRPYADQTGIEEVRTGCLTFPLRKFPFGYHVDASLSNIGVDSARHFIARLQVYC